MIDADCHTSLCHRDGHIHSSSVANDHGGGIKLNTPPGTEFEDPDKYNGHARIFGPDGQKLIPNPAKDFQGLVFVDVFALSDLCFHGPETHYLTD